MQGLFVYIFLLCPFYGAFGRKGFGPGEQEWDYVQVRPTANMFWWLYYTTANVDSYYDKPLVIWLQGGPGGSSTSFGNFEELGPLDTHLNQRNYTWVKDYNVLFIDNPVGTGFSYGESNSAFTKTNTEIANDLLECMKGFYKKLPQFENVSTYITTESYGGKMGAEFALVWDRAQKTGVIKSNLKGIGLGDAWISPIDSVMTWAPFLLSTGMVDTEGFEKIDAAARRTKLSIEMGKWTLATELWSNTQAVVLRETHNVDFYNILTKIRRANYELRYLSPLDELSSNADAIYRTFIDPAIEAALDRLMNKEVKEALGIQSEHGKQSRTVFNYLREDFMKPVTHEVELLLNETNLKVFVYNGHMDLIVDTPGTLFWVDQLKWKDSDIWKKSTRHAIVANDIVEGYVKTQGNFRMYWVNRAGHMVPRDNPAAMAFILQDLTSDTNNK